MPQQQGEARPQQARNEEHDVAQPGPRATGLSQPIPSDQQDAAQDDSRTDQVRSTQSFMQEQRGADGADDGHRRASDDSAMGEWREAITTTLQQRKGCTAQQGQNRGPPPAQAGKVACAETRPAAEA